MKITGDFEKKIAEGERKTSVAKERYLAKLRAYEAARRTYEKTLKMKEQKIQLELNKTLISCILDIGFEYQDITVIIGSLIKTKAILKGNDEVAKTRLINECIELYNKTAKDREWELNGFKKSVEEFLKKNKDDEAV